MRFFFLAWLFSGCSLLIGNIKPVTEKNSTYKHTDLSAPWKKISINDSIDQSDITYQNGDTESTISINSSCRKDEKYSSHSLKDLADVLLMGFEGKKTKNVDHHYSRTHGTRH